MRSGLVGAADHFKASGRLVFGVAINMRGVVAVAVVAELAAKAEGSSEAVLAAGVMLARRAWDVMHERAGTEANFAEPALLG